MENKERVYDQTHVAHQPRVYMCFSTDIIHSGHIAIIQKAAQLGRVTVGVLSDEAVANFKRFPLVPYAERKALIENIRGVAEVVEQKQLSYVENLRALKPDYVVHGDDWKEGFQKAIRDEVIGVLVEYGGRLVEYPYAKDDKYQDIEKTIARNWRCRICAADN